MSVFAIEMPEALFGVGSRKQIGEKLKAYGATKVFLMCDIFLNKAGFAGELADVIKEAGLDAQIYECEEGEPTSGKCNKAYQVAKEYGADGVVGLGGGSTLDSAKMVGLLLKNGGGAEEYIGYTNNKKFEIFKPIITLPTTAGTGAEVSQYISCSNDALGTKGAAVHPPTYAIVDPELTTGLPPAITAYTGIDALAHAVESIFNGMEDKMQHWMADTVSKEAVRLVFKWLPVAYKDGKNLEARSWMSYAALIAGYAIKLRRANFGHTIANQISNEYHFPHGVGVGMGLFAVMRYNVEKGYDSTRLIAEALDIPCPAGKEEEVGRELVKRFDALEKEVGMKTMKENGIKKEFLDTCIANIKADTKWQVVPSAPDFDHMAKAIYEAYEM